MRIGLIDVDSHNFPNLPLMKLSAWHKANGDEVEWYFPFGDRYDVVYMSKVFSFSEEEPYVINADRIVRGGSGYAIYHECGKERYDKEMDHDLPSEIEHIYPDYSLYGIEDTAYGFLTRGCPRGCEFCHVKNKEGLISRQVAKLGEFWHGQKKIVLLDPNIMAAKNAGDLLRELADTRCMIDFNQGIDIRLMTEEKATLLNRVKTKTIHFAWDKYEDKDRILPGFRMFREMSSKRERDLIVYVLCGFDTTFEQDLERVETLRDMGYKPYIMLYGKETMETGSKLRQLQRYVNSYRTFYTCRTFEEYDKSITYRSSGR